MCNPFEEINRRLDFMEHLLRQILSQSTSVAPKQQELEQVENPIKVDEVARILNVSIAAVYQNKSIPRHKRNNRLRFFRSEILAYIKDQPSSPPIQVEPYKPRKRKWRS